MSDTLNQLEKVLEKRKTNADPASSYVAQLHHKGLNKILEKVGEEAFETVLAAKDLAKFQELMKNESTALVNSSNKDKLKYDNNNDLSKIRNDVICETADLWFHTLVMLSHLNCRSDEVLAELERRFNLSGLKEKAQRKTN